MLGGLFGDASPSYATLRPGSPVNGLTEDPAARTYVAYGASLPIAGGIAGATNVPLQTSSPVWQTVVAQPEPGPNSVKIVRPSPTGTSITWPVYCVIFLVFLIAVVALLICYLRKLPPKTAFLHQHREGHFVSAPTHFSFDCQAGFFNWKRSWSEAKKSWCCQHHDRGCQTASSPFDCTVGAVVRPEDWSEQKKTWCCAYENTGCAPSHDCDAGFANWSTAWSEPKKQWCCIHAQKGCPSIDSPRQLGCEAVCRCENIYATCHDRIQFAATHEFAHHEDACKHAHGHVLQQCGVCGSCTIKKSKCQALSVTRSSNASGSHDCDVGASKETKGWSEHKRHYCCVNYNKSCHRPAGTSYDCKEDTENWYAEWSNERKAWCCSNHGFACEGTSEPALPAGPGRYWKNVKEDGYSTWVRASSENGDEISFDCHAGLDNFADRWSASKKSWCCETRGLGCTGPIPPALQAPAGFRWSEVDINGAQTWRLVLDDFAGAGE